MSEKLNAMPIEITEFSSEGHGKGIWQPEQGLPRCVEIPFTVPGDRVEAEVRKIRRGRYLGSALRLLKESPNRAAPRCLHFGRCGGCRWQQLQYEEQLRQKEARVRRCLEPHLSSKTLFHPILPCLPPWNYRNKMELTFSSDKSGKRYLGLVLYGTRGRVFQMQECHLAPPWMSEAVQAVSEWWEGSGLESYRGCTDQGSLRTLTLREGASTGDRLAMLTVSGNPAYSLQREALAGFISALRKAVEPARPDQRLSIFLRIQQIARGRPTQFYEMHLYGAEHIRERLDIQFHGNEDRPLYLHIGPSAFFQPNTKQAERLYSCALQMASIPEEATVYDLYCGTGTLGICFGNRAKRVVGIELSPESSLDARENVKLNALSNIEIRTGDVGDVLSLLAKEEASSPDLVVVDPPRAGLDPKALKHLLDLRTPQILYVSCNPETQAANLGVLIEGGYSLEEVQPIDQFPQTLHVENIGKLVLGCQTNGKST